MVTASINPGVTDPASTNRIIAMVSWDEPAVVNCNTTHYTLTVLRDSSIILITNVSATQYTINNGLLPNSAYTVTVWLNTLAGQGETDTTTISTPNDGITLL